MNTSSNSISRLISMIIESKNQPIILQTKNLFYFHYQIPNKYYFPSINKINNVKKMETMIDSLLNPSDSNESYSQLSNIKYPLEVFFEQWDNQQLFMNSINLDNDFILQARLITFQINDKQDKYKKSTIGVVIGALNQKSNTFIDFMFIKLREFNKMSLEQIVIYTNKNIIHDFNDKINSGSDTNYTLESYKGLSIEEFQSINQKNLQQEAKATEATEATASVEAKAPESVLSLKDIKSKVEEMAKNNPMDLITFLLSSSIFVHSNKSLTNSVQDFDKYKEQANLLINEFNVLNMPTIDINDIKYSEKKKLASMNVSLNFGEVNYDKLLEILFINNHNLLLELKKNKDFNIGIKKLFQSILINKELIVNSTLSAYEESLYLKRIVVKQSVDKWIVGNILNTNILLQNIQKRFSTHSTKIYNAIFDTLFNKMMFDYQINDFYEMHDKFNELVGNLPDWLEKKYFTLTKHNLPSQIHLSNGKYSKSLFELHMNGFDNLYNFNNKYGVVSLSNMDLSNFVITCEKGQIKLIIKKSALKYKNIKQVNDYLKATEIFNI